MSGHGLYTYADGSVYTGNISNDIFEGQGTMTLPDGRVYSGNWANNKLNG